MAGRKSKDTKGKTETQDRVQRATQWILDSPVFIAHRLYIPQAKEEGEGKRFLYQDARNKVITFSIPKASSDCTLG